MRSFFAPVMIILATLLALGLFSNEAFAFNGVNGVVPKAQSNFSCTAGGEPQGSLFERRICSVTSTTLFSGLICTFEENLSEIFGRLYCGMQKSLIKPITILLTLFVAVFGVMFTIGMTQFTAAEAMKTLFKFVLVWGFATQADLAIQYAYGFFLALAEEGVTIALSAFSGSTGNANNWSGDSALRYMDDIVLNFVNPFSGSTGQATNSCQNGIFWILIIIAITLPPVALLAIYVQFQTVLAFARAILGYLMSLMGLTFLMTISPIFFALALFKTTAPAFEKWVQYMISFALQMIIVFAFLSMIEIIAFGSFFSSLLDLVQPVPESQKSSILLGNGGFTTLLSGTPLYKCGICEYHMGFSDAYQMEVPLCDIPAEGQEAKIIPFGNLPAKSDFWWMLVTRLMALGILAVLMNEFMASVPEIAKQLTGTAYAPRLGGSGARGLQGFDLKFAGQGTVDAFVKGLEKGYQQTNSRLLPVKMFGALAGARKNFTQNVMGDALTELSATVGDGETFAPRVAHSGQTEQQRRVSLLNEQARGRHTK